MTTSSGSKKAATRIARVVVALLAWSVALAGASQPAGAGAGSVAGPQALQPAGVLNTLFLPVYGTDQSAGPESLASMQVAMGQVDQYYRSVSRGAVEVHATVSGWRQIPMSLSGTCGHVDLGATIAPAITAAQQAGLNPASYDRIVVFSHQSTTCTWGGGFGPGHTAAVNHLVSYTIIHELGHTLGLDHVRSHDCVGVFEGSCDDVDYGGRFDPMGTTFPDAFSFSGPSLDALGLLPTNEVTTVSGNGTFTLTPLASAPPGAKRLLRIPNPDPAAPTYTLEYRTPVGADAPMGGPAFQAWRPGVILHGTMPVSLGSTILQYDATPGSQADDFADGAVPVGSTIVDPNGLSITVHAQSAASATVSVQGFLSMQAPPSIRSVSFTSPENTPAAKVRVAWQNQWVAPNVTSVKVESSPQIGQPVTVSAHAGFADLSMPASPGCIRYRIRAVDGTGVQGSPSLWSTPRCFFDEVQPGSLVFRSVLRKASPAGAGTTAVQSSVEPTWGQTNHYLPGAFDGYSYELTVPGLPVVTGTTSGTVTQTGFAPAIHPVPLSSPRLASIVFEPRPGDQGAAELRFTFGGSVVVPTTAVSEGHTLHGVLIPADPHAASTFVRPLTPGEVTTTGCASAGASDVVFLPAPVVTPFPENLPANVAATSPSSLGRQFVVISVRGNFTPQSDRCLMSVSEVQGEPFTVRLIRITDDDHGVGASPGSES